MKFALEEEEIKKDEELVKQLSTFLKDKVIPKFITSLQNVEGVPTDSESLSH